MVKMMKRRGGSNARLNSAELASGVPLALNQGILHQESHNEKREATTIQSHRDRYHKSWERGNTTFGEEAELRTQPGKIQNGVTGKTQTDSFKV